MVIAAFASHPQLEDVLVRFFSRQHLILTLIVIFSSACSRDPNLRKQKYFQSGRNYFEKGKYREASIEFVNAIKIDPRYAEAHHQLAETYLKLQQPQSAY